MALEAKVRSTAVLAERDGDASHARGRWFETSRAHSPETLHSGISLDAGDLEPAPGIPSAIGTSA